MMKKIFVVDWVLIPSFLLCASTGIGMHVTVLSHDIWHSWAVVHVLGSLLFMAFAIVHIKMHWSWYRTLFTKGLGTKSRVTVAVSVLFVILALTGLLLLLVEGADSVVGRLHYIVGLMAIALFSGHTIKRFSILKKSLPGKGPFRHSQS